MSIDMLFEISELILALLPMPRMVGDGEGGWWLVAMGVAPIAPSLLGCDTL